MSASNDEKLIKKLRALLAKLDEPQRTLRTFSRIEREDKYEANNNQTKPSVEHRP